MTAHFVFFFIYIRASMIHNLLLKVAYFHFCLDCSTHLAGHAKSSVLHDICTFGFVLG